MFRDRERLSGQRRFIHLQVVDLEQAQIGWHAVAGAQEHNVAGDEIFGADASLLAVPSNSRFRADHFGQCFDGLFGLRFLEKTNDGVDQYHTGDDGGIDPLAKECGDCPGQEQDIHERLVKLLKEFAPGRSAAPCRDPVRAKLELPFFDFGIRQAFGHVNLQQSQRLFDVELMPMQRGMRGVIPAIGCLWFWRHWALTASFTYCGGIYRPCFAQPTTILAPHRCLRAFHPREP